MPSIGIAIPCFKGHITVLKRLLDSIENQTRKPDVVIVSCSSSTYADIHYKQEDYTFPFKIYTHVQKMNAAQNRNFAVSKLNTDIISFFDADDAMHPQRLEIIEKAFKENDIVLFLHSFVYGFDKIYEIYDLESVRFDIGKLGVYPWGYGARHLEIPNTDIHNSQSSILKYVANNLKYNEAPENAGREDSIYTAEIIKRYADKTGYCILPLSRYESCGSNT